jgi:transposase
MQYLLGTKEISSLQAHQKGAALKKATGKSLREIGDHVHLNHRQLSRGVKAMEQNRDTGVNGRPQSLNEEGVAIFVETIRKRMSVRVNTTHQEARELVIKIIPSFF